MTRAAEHRTEPRRAPIRVEAERAIVPFHVQWAIAARAIVREPEAAFVRGTAQAGRSVQLAAEVRLHGERAAVTLSLHAGSERRVLAHAEVSIIHDVELLHVDAPGLLRATLRLDSGEAAPATPRLLYADSPLLGTLGVTGGQAQPPEVVLLASPS